MESQTVELGADTLKALTAIANPGMLPGDWIALGVGLVQCALIGYGLYLMSKSNDERAEQTKVMREENQQRHEESMSALKTLNQESQQRHEESMSALKTLNQEGQQRHEESMSTLKTLNQEGQQRHEESLTALKTLIERTARP